MFWSVVSMCFLVYVSAEICPGGTHSCPQGATCCELPDEEYGCCPLPDAVCCDDHIHCCPNGFICNDGMCSQFSINSTRAAPKQDDVVCPGGVYTCPTNRSCCVNDDGEVTGCCMEPDAVCCPGGQYCCPNDTDCDLHAGHCTDKKSKAKVNLPIKVKKVQKPKKIQVPGDNLKKSFKLTTYAALSRYFSVICPDGRSACPDNFTCCQLPQGMWGCCPFPKANCCPDHMHCCPGVMTCSPDSQTCIQSGVNITSFETLPAVKYGFA